MRGFILVSVLCLVSCKTQGGGDGSQTLSSTPASENARTLDISCDKRLREFSPSGRTVIIKGRLQVTGPVNAAGHPQGYFGVKGPLNIFVAARSNETKPFLDRDIEFKGNWTEDEVSGWPSGSKVVLEPVYIPGDEHPSMKLSIYGRKGEESTFTYLEFPDSSEPIRYEPMNCIIRKN